jgi:beta-glucosidase
MPWINEVNSLLEAYYPGEEGGNAIANVLFGKVNPSGKLPETFPVKVSDNPAFGNYPGANNVVNYAEGIYVGYRHYDTRNIEPLFPFGHGLSYTTFEYKDLKIIKKGKVIFARFSVKNRGGADGSEVAQLYIHDLVSSENRPLKELKNFEKIFLKAGETKHISFEITDEDLSFFSAKQNNWVLESGEFEVLIGSSSRDIRLKKKLTK